MKINKEHVSRVIEIIDDLSESMEEFTFDYFCRQHNLYSDQDKERANGRFIICPFHNDKNPSLSIDEEKRRFTCFACGAGSRYIDFLTLYDREVLGLEMTVAQKANELLNKYPCIQSRAGFTTVYQKEIKSIDSFSKLSVSRFKKKENLPSNYAELATYILKEKYSVDQQLFAVALMQKGITPEVIVKQLKGLEIAKTVKKYSISELEEE